MKFKKLLFEDKNNKKHANKILQKEYKNDIPHLLYRGSKREPKSWNEYPIQKKRKPLTLQNRIQVLLDFVLKHRELKSVPLRKESKFATTSKSIARNFGDHPIIVFPEKGANIVSFEKDSAYYRSRIQKSLRKISRLEPFTDIIHLHKLSKIQNEKEFLDYLKSNWKQVKNEAKQMSEKHMFASVSSFYNNLNLYFKKMKSGIKEKSSEVIFDGKQYLGFNVNFFESHFKWNGQIWTTKEETK